MTPPSAPCSIAAPIRSRATSSVSRAKNLVVRGRSFEMAGTLSRERPRLGGILSLAAGLTLILVVWFGRACWGGWWVASAPTTATPTCSARSTSAGRCRSRAATCRSGSRSSPAAATRSTRRGCTGSSTRRSRSSSCCRRRRRGRGSRSSTSCSARSACTRSSGTSAATSPPLRGRDRLRAVETMVGRTCAAHQPGQAVRGRRGWLRGRGADWARRGRRPGGRRCAWARGGLLAGHVQIWFYAGPLVVAFALFEAKRRRLRELPRGSRFAAAARSSASPRSSGCRARELFQRLGDIRRSGAGAPMDCPRRQLLSSRNRAAALNPDEVFHRVPGSGAASLSRGALLRVRACAIRSVGSGLQSSGSVCPRDGPSQSRQRVRERPAAVPIHRAPGRAMTPVVLAGGGVSRRTRCGRRGVGGGEMAAIRSSRSSRRRSPSCSVDRCREVRLLRLRLTKTLPAGATDHRVHVLHGRYPYLERFGVRTLRDARPLDTPGYKALTKDPTPGVAWWFDVGARSTCRGMVRPGISRRRRRWRRAKAQTPEAMAARASRTAFVWTPTTSIGRATRGRARVARIDGSTPPGRQLR